MVADRTPQSVSTICRRKIFEVALLTTRVSYLLVKLVRGRDKTKKLLFLGFLA